MQTFQEYFTTIVYTKIWGANGVNYGQLKNRELRNFCLLYYLGKWCDNALLSNFRSIICQVVVYGRLKAIENFNRHALKVVGVALHERWSLTRGSKYSDFTWKLLVFWKTGRRSGRCRWSFTIGGRNRNPTVFLLLLLPFLVPSLITCNMVNAKLVIVELLWQKKKFRNYVLSCTMFLRRPWERGCFVTKFTAPFPVKLQIWKAIFCITSAFSGA